MKVVFTLMVGLCLTAFTDRLSAAASAASAGKDPLRSLARPVRIEFEFRFVLDSNHGLVVYDPERTAAEIEAARNSLKTEPDNPQLHLRLGFGWQETGETNRAHQEFLHAVELLRPLAEGHPQDGGLQAEFGGVLREAGQLEEAERFLRTTLVRLPKEWRCWKELGLLLQERAGRFAQRQGEAVKSGTSLDELLMEAGKCFDRLVELAPGQADAHLQRMMFRIEKMSLQASSAKASPDLPHASGAYQQNTVEDGRKAARLEPTNLVAQAVAAYFELRLAREEAGLADQDDDDRIALKAISEPSRKRILEIFGRLEKLGQGTDPKPAAQALEMLGSLQYFTRNDSDAMTGLRHALALDPGRYQAWETLYALLAEAREYDDLLALCDRRIRAHDSVHNRLLYAQACLDASKPGQALPQAEQAVRLAPDDPFPQLAVMAIHLRMSKEDEQLETVQKDGNHLSEMIDKLSLGGENLRLYEGLVMNRAIYLGLTGHTEEARKFLEDWIVHMPSPDWAKEILAALGP